MQNRIKKYLIYLPALIIMIMIFLFSSETADESSNTSSIFTQSVVSMVDNSFRFNWDTQKIIEVANKIEHIVRKIAHFTEYMILGLSFSIPLAIHKKANLKHLFIFALFCSVYAASDEFHQYFVPGRAASIIDVMIDSCGAITGIFLVKLFLFLYTKKQQNISK